MTGYLVRRLLQLIPVVLVVSLVLFMLLRLMPGDPTLAILGQEATEQDRAVLRKDLGLDVPVWQQFTQWLGDLARGDLGTSWLTDEKVGMVISDRFAATLELGIIALAFAVLIGIPAGILAAVRRRTRTDTVLNSGGLLALSTPHFYLAALLILVFALWLKILPPSGYVPFTEDPVENLRRMILPAVTIGSTIAAVTMRQTRAALLAAFNEDYIRTAEASGLSRRRIVGVYALRNAIVPVVTVIALQIGALMSATVVTETVFTVPGMGTLIVNGIFSRDLPVVQGAVLMVVVLVLLVNLLADLVYAWLDPRITY
ncbi:ABC transporter permease [Streptomyces cyaneofuscatus]|uniref:ABC transporter permease n=1 Tax=Streptomyces cyaneofuscatus TaxID=66883 RepID=UPI00380C8811